MSRTLMLDQVHALSKAALIGAGALEETASLVADSIVDAEAEGIRDVGLAYLDYYCQHVLVGKVAGEAVPRVKQTGKAALMADARNGFCHPAFVEGEKKFYAAARACGLAGFGIQHSYAPGAIGWYVDRIAKAGLVGFCFANTSASMAPAGGKRPLFGTNPIAFGVPRYGKPPLVVDQSATVTSRVSIIQKMDAGEPIPEGWGLDAAGNPCTDPKAVLNGGSMASSGGYKGSAMALLVEVMAAGLTGANWSYEASDLANDVGGPPDLGQFFMAIDPEAFGGTQFSSRIETLIGEMLRQDGVRLPGDRRHAHRLKASRDGVVVPDRLFQTLCEYARRGEAA
jgi:(2R)-3-sulfolactate dehydrogenase (NADP+)